jgi:hypothetical protein
MPGGLLQIFLTALSVDLWCQQNLLCPSVADIFGAAAATTASGRLGVLFWPALDIFEHVAPTTRAPVGLGGSFSHAARAAVCFMLVWNSTGVKWPSAARRRRHANDRGRLDGQQPLRD